VLDPREPGESAPPPEVPEGRMLLRVPARSAFGTGSHASTRLALRLLERLDLAGRSVLDVGIGSGVLAMVAMMLDARRAFGFDLDLAAALLAPQHARLNGLRVGVWAGGSAALSPHARFGVVVVNALPHEVLPEAARIAGAVAADGELVISGVLASEGEATLQAWAERGLSPTDTLAEEEWAAWTLRRT
jgi:ribosomal protein L11 methyltransferase